MKSMVLCCIAADDTGCDANRLPLRQFSNVPAILHRSDILIWPLVWNRYKEAPEQSKFE